MKAKYCLLYAFLLVEEITHHIILFNAALSGKKGLRIQKKTTEKYI